MICSSADDLFPSEDAIDQLALHAAWSFEAIDDRTEDFGRLVIAQAIVVSIVLMQNLATGEHDPGTIDCIGKGIRRQSSQF